jgi:hypothetical protein
MQIPVAVLIFGVLFSIPISSGFAQGAFPPRDKDRVAAAGSINLAGHVYLAAASVTLSARVAAPDGKNSSSLLRGTKCPHISEETPARQAIAPQKSQTPDGSSIVLEAVAGRIPTGTRPQ